MSQDSFTTIIRGFDVLVEPSDTEGTYLVSVTESSGLPWQVEIPVNLDDFEGENEFLDGSNEILTYVSEAAVDLFESQRGTLGEGAGALEATAMSKKRAYSESMYWEDWFYKLKGTPFEQEAVALLEQLFALDLESDEYDKELSAQWDEESKICHELNMLNLERMKAAPADQIVIVVQGSRKTSCWGVDSISEFLDCFAGDPLEGAAIAKVRELLDVRDRMNNVECAGTWKKRQEIERQMEDLLLSALQQNVHETPMSPVEKAPNMADDLAELMEGVDLQTPLTAGVVLMEGVDLSTPFRVADAMPARTEPGRPQIRTPGMGPVEQGEMKIDRAPLGNSDDFPNKLSEADPIGPPSDEHDPMGNPPQHSIPSDGVGLIEDSVNVRVPPRGSRADQIKLAFEEIETAEEREDELGNIRHDLDPGLIEDEQYAFNSNERVQLKNDVTVTTGWGQTTTYPKGTRGYAESQFDKQGDYYFMRLDDGRLIKVRWDDLKASSKRE